MAVDPHQIFRPRKQAPQWRRLRVPVGGEIWEFQQIRNLNALLDSMNPSELADEKIPYYGQIWPASIGLARWIWKNLDLQEKRVLDLGCGIGLTGVAAAKKGARVCFADYFAKALELARENALRNGCDEQEYLTLDWRDSKFSRKFDLVFASDVLYETRNHKPILSFLERALGVGGIAVIADPDRPSSRPFFKLSASSFAIERFEMKVQHEEKDILVVIMKMVRKEPPKS